MFHQFIAGQYKNRHILTFCEEFRKLTAVDLILSWLIKQQLTGAVFIEWTMVNRYSPLQCARYIAEKIRVELKLKDVYKL